MWLFNVSAWLGKIYATLTRQQLEGKPVVIKLSDTTDRNLEGTLLHGNIHSLPLEAFTSGPEGSEGRTKHGPGSLIIQLTMEPEINSLGAQWFLATPRWAGHTAYRLFIAPIVVSLARIDVPAPTPTASYEQIVAIGIIKLEKN